MDKENGNNGNQDNTGSQSGSQSPYRDTNTTVERSGNQDGTTKKQIKEYNITNSNPYKIALLAL